MDTREQIEGILEGHQRELIEAATMLFAVQQVYGEKVREQTKTAYAHLVDAHLLIMGVLAAALLRVNGKIAPVTRTSEQRKALFASFVLGIRACESAIEEGRYLQALALLRQEMETLAQLKAVRAGKRRTNGSPNVVVLEKSLARLYGELCAAAHVSKHDIVRSSTECEVSGDDLPGPTSGTRYFPALNDQLARRSFSLHLMLTIGLIDEMSIDLREQHAEQNFTARDAKALRLAQVLMHTEGMVELD